MKINASNKGEVGGQLLMVVSAALIFLVVILFLAYQAGYLTDIGSKISNLITFKTP